MRPEIWAIQNPCELHSNRGTFFPIILGTSSLIPLCSSVWHSASELISSLLIWCGGCCVNFGDAGPHRCADKITASHELACVVSEFVYRFRSIHLPLGVYTAKLCKVHCSLIDNKWIRKDSRFEPQCRQVGFDKNCCLKIEVKWFFRREAKEETNWSKYYIHTIQIR